MAKKSKKKYSMNKIQKSEGLRQCEMAWKRGFQLGLACSILFGIAGLIGIVIVFLICLLI